MSSQAGTSRSSRPTPSPSSQRVKRERSPVEGTRVKEEEEEREDTPQTQELDEHYVTIRTDVVGVQYYRGMVGKGEYVMLQRQPANRYDPNAVQVLNAAGLQVGHIPRAVAQRVAMYMDEGLIKVEGRMVGQNLDMAMHYKLGMDMSIYAKPSHRTVLEPELKWAFDAAKARAPSPAKSKDPRFKGKGRMLVDPVGSGGSGSGLPQPGMDPKLQGILDGLKKVEKDEKQSDKVMDSLTQNLDVTQLPLHPSPPGIANGQLNVDILPHQSQALQWMIEHENPKLPEKAGKDVQFWTRQSGTKGGRDYWLNVATRTPQAEEPELGRGGIIADGMGLGKTLTTLSLVLATKEDAVGPNYCKTTLIVCPLSVLSNWEKQVRDHVSPGQLTMYTYHGASRNVTAKTLQDYDIVLTTYQTVAGDMATAIPTKSSNSTANGLGSSQSAKKAKVALGPLGKVKWKRVVADEGHVLKNPKAKMTLGFASLDAERRWVCTGTPIVNSPADLGSLLTCIKVCKPLDQADYFKALLLRPLRSSDAVAGAEAAKLLQALVGQILLRRTKDSTDKNGKKLFELPPIEYFRCPIELDEETRGLYKEVLDRSKERFLRAVQEGTGALNVLSMLTRLRQMCLSADLVPQSFIDEVRSPISTEDQRPAVTVAYISPEKRAELIGKLQQAVADNEECPICCDELDPARAPCITDCGHPACLPCISAWLVKATSCPQCRHTITPASLLELPPPVIDVEEGDASQSVAKEKGKKQIKSAKIDELVRYLSAFPAGEKTLVFSQFTTFLDHVAARLDQEGIEHVRFDGSMPAKKRQQVIAAFQRPPAPDGSDKAHNPRVMLISLKSGAVGLNLTAASNVFLCDPWWQSAIEAQASSTSATCSHQSLHKHEQADYAGCRPSPQGELFDMGQRKPVRVFQLIAKDTIESQVLDIPDEVEKKKDDLVAKAFEKTGKESKKDKREARFDEIKALLGITGSGAGARAV